MWFEVLKWLSEQEDATTVAELQQQVDALVRIGKDDVIFNIVTVVIFAVVVIMLVWYMIGLDKRIKKLEAALLEKRADSCRQKSI